MHAYPLPFLYLTANFIENENNKFNDCSISKQQPVQPTFYLSPQRQSIYYAQLDKPLGPQMQRTVLLSPCEPCIENENSNIIHSVHSEVMSGYNRLDIE